MNASEVHAASYVIDGCSWTFEGWTEKLAKSGATALNVTAAGADEDFVGAMYRIEPVIQTINADPARFLLARSAADIRRAKAEGKVAIVLNFQNGRPLELNLRHLHLFREVGVRNIQITYNERNYIGDGCLEPTNSGLSTFGKQVIKEMNRLGVLIDLSHVGERTALEAMELSEAPVVFSHSNPKKRANNPRNITDEQIKLCAQTGGVIGMCGWGPMCWRGNDAPPNVDDFVGHIEYTAELVGVDHVAVSTDSTTTMRTAHMIEHAAEINAAYPTVVGAYVAKFGTSLEHRYPVSITHLPDVTAKLLERGWSAEDVGKVMGGNFLRVWEQVWGG